MASIWKHPQSQYWVACFTDHTGKQRKKSTKEKNKKEALKHAEKLESAYRKARTSSQMQKLLMEAHKEITGEDIEQVNFASYRGQWLAAKTAEGCAAATVKFYTHATSRFETFLGLAAKGPISNIHREMVEKFRNELAASLSAQTTNHQIKGLRMLFKAAMESGVISENPAAFVKTISTKRVAKKRKQAFSIEQVRQILPHCAGEWKGMVLFGLYTGQRLADIQHLTWKGVSEDCSKITLITRKTGRSMTIPAAGPLLAHLKSLDRPDSEEAYLHPKAAALKSNTLSGRFADILIEARIRPKDGNDGARDHTGLSFHSLRHSAVTILKEAGIPQAVVMELIGHESEAMSQNYTKVGDAALEKAAAAFPIL